MVLWLHTDGTVSGKLHVAAAAATVLSRVEAGEG